MLMKNNSRCILALHAPAHNEQVVGGHNTWLPIFSASGVTCLLVWWLTDMWLNWWLNYPHEPFVNCLGVVQLAFSA
jgi:hypothetical protein